MLTLYRWRVTYRMRLVRLQPPLE
eukprot:COSAG02_NODE_48842_length_331_cov_0.663793_1_plen_23_part_10